MGWVSGWMDGLVDEWVCLCVGERERKRIRNKEKESPREYGSQRKTKSRI